MNRMIKWLVAVCIFTLSATPGLHAQKYEKGLIDKTIAIIGGEAIMLSQLESEIQMMMAQGVTSDRNLRCEVLENMLVQKLFLNQAKLDSLTVKEDQVESTLEERIANVMTQLGGEKQTVDYFKKPIYKIKQDWREALREQSLTQQMQQKVMQSAGTMTPAQVEKFYKKIDKDSLPIISTQYKYSQIALYPSKDNAVLAVKEKLLEFRNRVLNGEKFSTLASLYSEDPGSAARGGELRMASKNIYWPAFADAAIVLKPGQMSQIVETPDGYHIIQMIERDGDMFNARHILLKPQFTTVDRDKAFKTLDSLRSKILADSITFEKAARYYSKEMKTATNGGQVVDENTGSTFFEKDQLKPVDYNILKDMKEGQISEPFESLDNEGRGNTIYKIIRFDKVILSHTATCKDDFIVVQNVGNTTLQKEAIDKFVKEKQEITYIKLDDMFKNCPFERSGWVK
jgi:peptidyl-prolyl cis-trans isomerase SurA